MKPRVSAFGVIVPSAILLMVAGGLFFRARAQDARQRRLELVQRMLERTLIPGLELHPDVISMKEFDVLTAVLRRGVPRLLYLNTRAEHRFFKDSVPSKMCFDCTQEVTPYPVEVLDAVETSWETHSPAVIRFDAHGNDVIIPLASKKRALGMVLLRVSDSVLTSLAEASIAISLTPHQNGVHPERNKPNPQPQEEVNLSGREYRRKAEAIFAR